MAKQYQQHGETQLGFGEDQSGKGLFVGNSNVVRCQLLEAKEKERLSKCGTQ
jgi:hypothetical protein